MEFFLSFFFIFIINFIQTKIMEKYDKETETTPSIASILEPVFISLEHSRN